ncbi:MAG: hypothetical protein MAG715_00797 [Methanonatronarchaeales archaeon]|nr:hypothetical protein [Methanonatronarchaeales archaeon]
MTQGEDIEDSLEMLEGIRSDESIPRNIRKAAEEASGALRDESLDKVVKVSRALNSLESVIEEPNVPVHARTQIWSVASRLEAATNTG